jgi:hypothetical protein
MAANANARRNKRAHMVPLRRQAPVRIREEAFVSGLGYIIINKQIGLRKVRYAAEICTGMLVQENGRLTELSSCKDYSKLVIYSYQQGA